MIGIMMVCVLASSSGVSNGLKGHGVGNGVQNAQVEHR